MGRVLGNPYPLISAECMGRLSFLLLQVAIRRRHACMNRVHCVLEKTLSQVEARAYRHIVVVVVGVTIRLWIRLPQSVIETLRRAGCWKDVLHGV